MALLRNKAIGWRMPMMTLDTFALINASTALLSPLYSPVSKFKYTVDPSASPFRCLMA